MADIYPQHVSTQPVTADRQGPNRRDIKTEKATANDLLYGQ